MAELTRKEHWDSIYKSKDSGDKQRSLKKGLRTFIEKLLEAKYIGTYADYLLWEVICQRYVPKREGAKVLEVGSAPGGNLIRMGRRFGFIPYGVEYSDKGVEINRKLFIAHNINPDNVIRADFFSDGFQEKYRKQFDVVISMGFVEHFDNVKGVIAKHINLLKEGGYLVVSIPNLRGVNYILQRLFDKEILSIIDLDIMQKGRFAELFDRECLSTLFCDYYGTFNFGVFGVKRKSPLWLVLTFGKILQLLLNVFFRLLFGNHGAESRFFSPYLLFIGIKKQVGI